MLRLKNYWLSLKKMMHKKASELTSEEFTQLLKDLRDDLKKGKENSKLLVDAGAPIGWPADIKPTCLWKVDEDTVKKARDEAAKAKANAKAAAKTGSKTEIKTCHFSVYLPKSTKDAFWLLMGGLLIGLGAPFWAKAIGQIKQGQSVIANATSILKPAQVQPKSVQVMNMTATAADDVPLTTMAFKVAAKSALASNKQ